MKESWTYKKFKDICYSISDGDWIEKKDQSDSGIRLIQTGNIGVGVFIPKDDSQKFISEETFNRLRCTEIFEGDILISRLPNPLGRSCLLPKLKTKCITAVDCSILKIKEDIVSPQFFVYYTQSQGYFSKINSESSGTTRARITRKKLEETDIPIPPLSEQQRIVSRLDSAFAHIDELKANAEKQLSEARTLFQKALTKAMEPKEGWEEKMFGDLVVSNIVGLTRGKVEQGYDKKYPYFKMNNISPNNTLCWDDLICVDANEEEIEKYCLQEGDFLFNTRNSKEWVGKSTVYRDYDAPVMLYNNNVMRIRFVDIINPVFVAYSFLADYTKDQLEKIKSGTTNVWAIYYRDLSKIFLTYPSPSEQQSIVATLDSLKSKVDRLQANFEKISQECDALKQALLRKVFE